MVLLSRRFGDAGGYMVAWDFPCVTFELGITILSLDLLKYPKDGIPQNDPHYYIGETRGLLGGFTLLWIR